MKPLVLIDIAIMPGQQVVDPDKVMQITQLFGAVTIAVAPLDHELVFTPLRSPLIPGRIPATKRRQILGILCGSGVGNLVVVGFRKEFELIKFMDANLALDFSPVTYWNAWYLMWFRTDCLPPSQEFQHPEMILVTGGVVPLTWMGKQAEAAEVMQRGFPKVIAYMDLCWPVLAPEFKVKNSYRI